MAVSLHKISLAGGTICLRWVTCGMQTDYGSGGLSGLGPKSQRPKNTRRFDITCRDHALYIDPATGDVYFYAGTEDATRIYKITGWKNWTHNRRIGTAKPDALWTDK